MVDLIKRTKNVLKGQSIRKDIDENTLYDLNSGSEKNAERVVDYEPLPTGEYIIK